MHSLQHKALQLPRAAMSRCAEIVHGKHLVRQFAPTPYPATRQTIAPTQPGRHVHCSAQPTSGSGSRENSTEAYSNLQGAKARRDRCDVTSRWKRPDLLARELKAEVLPKLKDGNTRLYLIGMGPPERGLEFAELTEFPADQLIADPENVTYDRLQLKKSGPFWTFFDPRTPITLAKRAFNGGLGSTFLALSNWRPWIPKKQGQAFQQGGIFLFQGKEVIWQQYDQAMSVLERRLLALIPNRAKF